MQRVIILHRLHMAGRISTVWMEWLFSSDVTCNSYLRITALLLLGSEIRQDANELSQNVTNPCNFKLSHKCFHKNTLTKDQVGQLLISPHIKFPEIQYVI